MKTLKDLFELIALAVNENTTGRKDWFIKYYGHINQMSIKYYYLGWKADSPSEEITEELNEEGIQAAYWFVMSRLSTKSKTELTVK